MKPRIKFPPMHSCTDEPCSDKVSSRKSFKFFQSELNIIAIEDSDGINIPVHTISQKDQLLLG
jgi:hypothetical protein